MRTSYSILLLCCYSLVWVSCTQKDHPATAREKILLNDGWRFMKYDGPADSLIYDVRPTVSEHNDSKDADTEPTEREDLVAKQLVLKPWIMPTGNPFIQDSSRHYKRPEGHPPGFNFPFVSNDFDDQTWQIINLPHDWGIEGPFQEGWNAEVGGGMGRLPSHGVAWYRRKLELDSADSSRQIFLEVEGAMSYAMVWCNGQLVGGWPYGYNSWQLNLTPYLKFGEENQLAIRIDNPPHSARWYPGGGLYRNVWLIKTQAVHLAQWGTYIRTQNVSAEAATLLASVRINNEGNAPAEVAINTAIYTLDQQGIKNDQPELVLPAQKLSIPAGKQAQVEQQATVEQPRLWEPLPAKHPQLYVAVHTLVVGGEVQDVYETRFGIRSVEFSPSQGLLVNGSPVRIQGVNQHHDLGALGTAFNRRAAERQLEVLRDMGCNAIRMAHNPPAPELLDLTDEMGFLVIDEIFDVWERKKTPLDFHLIFPEWYEQDLRSWIRRDRNHPSVIAWSYGNEVGEQYTAEAGAELSQRLSNIVNEEDPTRPATASMNYAKPHMPFPRAMDLISLNYQGEGIRDAPAYAHLKGITTSPLYPAFRDSFPTKAIISSETAAAVSSRATYLFPVSEGRSAPVEDGSGGDPTEMQVSAYELYTAPFGASADKVFRSQDQHPFVAGEFVWSGWDYLGEPTPYYLARSSYFGIIDLAGFPKDRYFLYQSRWRPDLPLVHILPHWNWPQRSGQITPVHVFTSGDEVELFLNGKSLGRKKKQAFEYRLRWDDVIYEAGTLSAVAYKNGKEWASQIVQTSGPAAQLKITADRNVLSADGKDLCFISVEVQDADGRFVPTADPLINFSVEGPGAVVATDNGDPTNMTTFSSPSRKAFNGRLLAIVRANKGSSGILTVTAQAAGLQTAKITIQLK